MNLFRIPGAQYKTQLVVLARVSQVLAAAPANPAFLIQINGQVLGNGSQAQNAPSLLNPAKP